MCERFSLLKSDSSFGRDGIAELNGHPWNVPVERARRRVFPREPRRFEASVLRHRTCDLTVHLFQVFDGCSYYVSKSLLLYMSIFVQRDRNA
jgi:hypothetical protein